MMQGSDELWLLFAAFVGALTVGVAMAVGAFARSGRAGSGLDAREILDERFARGEVSSEEYASRAAVLGRSSTRRGRALRPFAIALVTVGLVGALATGVGAGVRGGWHVDMRGMHGMMGGGSATSGTAPPPSPNARTLRVVADEFSFRPSTLRLRAGETVTLVLDNRGSLFHTLTISRLDFELRADGGKTARGALTVSTPGSYELVCGVAGHAEAGMRGTLVVEPSS